MKIVLLERASVGTDVDVSGFGACGELVCYDNTATEEEAAARLADADVAVVNKAPLTRAVLCAAQKLRFVQVLATGYDNVDAACCRERGIRVANVAGYSTAMVAQHTLTLALCLSQKLAYYDHYVKSGAYGTQRSFTHFAEPFCELDGKTWGIVGLGSIGRRVAMLAEAFGCRVIWHSLTGRAADAPYERVGKDELLARSDFLSLHCPLSDLSRGFIDEDALAKMKPAAYLINVARGPVVDTAALCRALERGEIAGAGLDVLEREPLPPDHPLCRIRDSGRLIVTPHLAWASVEARNRLVAAACAGVARFLRGETEGFVV